MTAREAASQPTETAIATAIATMTTALATMIATVIIDTTALAAPSDLVTQPKRRQALSSSKALIPRTAQSLRPP